MKVYAIGGLGADERVFSDLTLGFELIPLKWITPKSDEDLKHYAVRFAKQINTQEPYAILGVSFGGIMAIELNKILSPSKIILISSATSDSDIPTIFRLFGKTGLIKILPNFLLKPPTFLANYFFGVSTDKYKATLKRILADTDINFLKWAIHQITNWSNSEPPDNVLRIHGDSDRLLKYSKGGPLAIIPNAGHFMIMSHADEISELLNKEFN